MADRERYLEDTRFQDIECKQKIIKSKITILDRIIHQIAQSGGNFSLKVRKFCYNEGSHTDSFLILSGAIGEAFDAQMKDKSLDTLDFEAFKDGFLHSVGCILDSLLNGWDSFDIKEKQALIEGALYLNFEKYNQQLEQLQREYTALEAYRDSARRGKYILATACGLAALLLVTNVDEIVGMCKGKGNESSQPSAAIIESGQQKLATPPVATGKIAKPEWTGTSDGRHGPADDPLPAGATLVAPSRQ